MKKMMFLVLISILFLVLIYFFGFNKTSTENMIWKSVKFNTKILIVLFSVYTLAIYLIYKWRF